MADPAHPSRHDSCDASGHRPAGPDRCSGVQGRLPLSCERIVDAAVRYVDSDCLDGLSMRRLGAELGVEAMSLYRYFPSKAALMDAVVCRMLADLELPSPDADPSAGWDDAVRAYARSYRALSTAHPRLRPLLATVGPANPTLAAIDRRMVALWRAAGFDATTAVQAQTALQGYLAGSCLQGAGTAEGDGAFALGLDALVTGLGARLSDASRP